MNTPSTDTSSATTGLYAQVLLWHKLTAQVTGGLALCSAKHRLNRAEAEQWIRYLQNVMDDIQAVLAGQPAILDSKGQRVVVSTDCGAPVTEVRTPEPRSNELSPPSGTQGAAKPRKATRKT